MFSKEFHPRRMFYVLSSPPRRLPTLLMTLVLVFSLVPVAASASEPESIPSLEAFKERLSTGKGNPNGWSYGDYLSNQGFTYEEALENINGDIPPILSPADQQAFREWLIEYVMNYYGMTAEEAEESVPHICAWNYGHTRTEHFLYCSAGCGVRKSARSHNHDGANGSCTCGYAFYTNATLTTLGLDGLQLDKRFDPEITEYTATPVAWKKVTETRIHAFPFDAKSTVEISEDLTVKPGAVYTIKVTADDSVTTRTYTITVA